MVEKKIKFITSGQLMSFCDTCQNMKSDIDVTDMSNRNFRIDGKSILGTDVDQAGIADASDCRRRG